jgi:hypothetical protein
MSDPIEYGAVNRFQAGAIGEPGKRTFYLYIETTDGPKWFTCEKGQVSGLAQQSIELLNRLERPIDEALVELTVNASTDLPWPTSPDDILFRVGAMAMQLGEDALTLILRDVDDEMVAMFDLTPEQLRAMSLIALNAVHAGRPICPKCQLPEDLEGHDCPSSNGHRH